MRCIPDLLTQESYSPDRLIDTLIQCTGVKNDRRLAIALGLSVAAVSKVRCRRMAVTGDFLLAAHELTGISIQELRQLMGDTVSRFWMGNLGRWRPQPEVKPTAASIERQDFATSIESTPA